MTKRKLEDMTPDEFEHVLDDFVDREPTEMPALAFFPALASLDHQTQQDARAIHRKGL